MVELVSLKEEAVFSALMKLKSSAFYFGTYGTKSDYLKLFGGSNKEHWALVEHLIRVEVLVTNKHNIIVKGKFFPVFCVDKEKFLKTSLNLGCVRFVYDLIRENVDILVPELY